MPREPRVSSLQKDYTAFALKKLGVARSFVMAKEMNTSNKYYLSWRGILLQVFITLSVFPEKDPFIFCSQVCVYAWLPTFCVCELQHGAEGLTIL